LKMESRGCVFLLDRCFLGCVMFCDSALHVVMR
jgi:hypothetical protein